MDSFDIKILNIVQRDNQLSTERIAEQVGLSPSAVQRRLKRLRKDEIIKADVSIISPEASGRRLIAITEVTFEPERPISLALEEFKRTIQTTPEVMQCYHVTGNADFILIIMAKDIQDYDALARRLFIENPSVKRYQTSIVVNTVKLETVIQLIQKLSDK